MGPIYCAYHSIHRAEIELHTGSDTLKYRNELYPYLAAAAVVCEEGARLGRVERDGALLEQVVAGGGRHRLPPAQLRKKHCMFHGLEYDGRRGSGVGEKWGVAFEALS